MREGLRGRLKEGQTQFAIFNAYTHARRSTAEQSPSGAPAWAEHAIFSAPARTRRDFASTVARSGIERWGICRVKDGLNFHQLPPVTMLFTI